MVRILKRWEPVLIDISKINLENFKYKLIKK